MARTREEDFETAREALIRARAEAREKDSILVGAARNSYTVAKAVHWLSRIEVRPRLRIPVPRAFTTRDP